jgi:undecaprenyl-phosphate 4-deoxy-4-formamido-L-arabinose transferase
LGGIGFGAFLMIMRLLYGSTWAAEGVFTLFAILFVFIGSQFIAMGLLGEYIGRIYTDVRGRPRYFIRRIIGGQAEMQPAHMFSMEQDQVKPGSKTPSHN